MNLINTSFTILIAAVFILVYSLKITIKYQSWNRLKFISFKIPKLNFAEPWVKVNIYNFNFYFNGSRDRWLYLVLCYDRIEIEKSSPRAELISTSSDDINSPVKGKSFPVWITPLIDIVLGLINICLLKRIFFKINNFEFFQPLNNSKLIINNLEYSPINTSINIKKIWVTSHHPPINLDSKEYSGAEANLILEELNLKFKILLNRVDLTASISKLYKVLKVSKKEANESEKSKPIDIGNTLKSIYSDVKLSNTIRIWLQILKVKLETNIEFIEVVKPSTDSLDCQRIKFDRLSLSFETILVPNILKLAPKSTIVNATFGKLDFDDQFWVSDFELQFKDSDKSCEYDWKVSVSVNELIGLILTDLPNQNTSPKTKSQKTPRFGLPKLPFDNSVNLCLTSSINKVQLIVAPEAQKLSQLYEYSNPLQLTIEQLSINSTMLNYHCPNKFDMTSQIEFQQLSLDDHLQPILTLNHLEVLNYNDIQFNQIEYFISTETNFDIQSFKIKESEIGIFYQLLPYIYRIYTLHQSNVAKPNTNTIPDFNFVNQVDAESLNTKIPVSFRYHKFQFNLHHFKSSFHSYNWDLTKFQELVQNFKGRVPNDHCIPHPRILNLTINSFNFKLEGLLANFDSVIKFDSIDFDLNDDSLFSLNYFNLVSDFDQNQRKLGLKGNLQTFQIDYELIKFYYLLKLVNRFKDIKDLSSWLLNSKNSDTTTNGDIPGEKKDLNFKLDFSLFRIVTKIQLKPSQIIWIYFNHTQLNMKSLKPGGKLPSVELTFESIRLELDPKVLPTIPNSIKFLQPPETEEVPDLSIIQLESIKVRLSDKPITINQKEQDIVYVELVSTRFSVPDKILLYEFIDELSLQVKSLRLLVKPQLGTVLPPPKPSPPELKPNLPFVLDLTISEWVIVIENNKFEEQLNRSIQVGWDEQSHRMFLDSQLDFKMQSTSNRPPSGLQRPQFKRAPPTSSSFISQQSSNTRVSDARRPDYQLAMLKLKEVKSTRWISKIQELDHKYPIAQASGTKFHIQLSPTHLKATTKAEAVCLIDEQTPNDTFFDLFLSFHIFVHQEQFVVRLRDYPIPLLHVPKLHPDQINNDLTLSYSQAGEIIIAEPWGGEETAKWRTISIDPDNNTPDLSICKTLTPIKFYQHQRISIHSKLPTTLTFGVAYRPALADIARRLDTLTSPSFPNVSPLGWWDKARLQMHSKLKIEFLNDGEFRALMLGTDHPYIKSTNYSQIETKYGFQHVWKGGTCITFKGHGVQNFSIKSDCYRLVIPKLALAENSSTLGVVNPMGQLRQKRLKVVIKLKNSVILESNWSYSKRHDFDPQLNIPIEVPHYEVIPKVPKANQIDYDPFKGFRSDRISILINVKSQPTSDTMLKRDVANSFHFTPQTWTCVRRFLQLFDSDRSLPIHLGTLFPKKLPPSSTPFSTRLFQIQFELNLHPTYVSYNLTVGPQNSQRDYVNLLEGVGIKGGSNALNLNIVMGKRNKILLDRESNQTPVTPLSPTVNRQSNALEWYLKRMCFDVDQPDIRTVGVKYILQNQTEDPSDDPLSDVNNHTQDKPFQLDDDGWLDYDDHKNPWNLTSEAANISVKVQPFLSAPKLTYWSGEEYNGLSSSELPYDPLRLELDMYNRRLKYLNKKIDQIEEFMNDPERCNTEETNYLANQQMNRMESHKQKLLGIIGVKKNYHDDHSQWEGISYSRHLNVYQPIMLIDQTNQKHLHHFLFLMDRDTALSDFWKRRYRSGLAQLERRYHQTMKQMANMGRKGKKKNRKDSKQDSMYKKDNAEAEKIFEEILSSFRSEAEPVEATPASTPDELSPDSRSHVITEPVWLINLYALQMVFLPNHDFVSDLLFPVDTNSSESADDPMKSLVLSVYQTQLSIGKIFEPSNQQFFGPVLIQERYNLNVKYAQFFVTDDNHHHNHCSIYHSLAIPYSKPCDETSIDREYSNWVPIELIIPRCRGDQEDFISTQEIIDNFKMDNYLNNVQYESIVLPFQSHLTYIKPNPLYIPNTSEGAEMSEDWSIQDHIHLEIPQFHLRTNGSQYFALLSNIQGLLTYHEPRKRRFREQLDERSLLVSAIGWQQEFRRLCNLWDSYQDQILMYHQVLNNSAQMDTVSESFLNEMATLELDYLTCLDQLIQVISVLTDESKRQFSPTKTNSTGAQLSSSNNEETQSLSKLIEIEIKEVDWNLLDTLENNFSKPFCELKSKSVKFILNLDPDGAQRLRFLVEQVVGFNLIEDTRYIQLLTPHTVQTQRNLHRFTTGDMIHVYLKMLPKVGGMEVIDHLEINIFPCLIQITHAITKKVIDFLGLKHGISNNTSKGSDKKVINSSDKLTTTKDNTVVDLMKKRAQLNLTFIYIKVPATQLCMSYQGKKHTNFADLHQVTFKTPDLVYHNQTLSWLEFLEIVKKEVIHAAFVQAGGLVKDLIMNKPPPAIGLAARSRVHSSSPISRSRTQISENSNISGFASPRSQVFYIENPHPGDAKSITTNETQQTDSEGWQDTRSRLSLPYRLFGIPKLRVTSENGDLASIASSRSQLSTLSNPALDRDENSSIGSTVTTGQSTAVGTPNPSSFAPPSPSSTLPMRKGTSLDISKTKPKYGPSYSIRSYAMSQTISTSPSSIQFEFLRTNRHQGPDLARVIDPDIQLEVIMDNEFLQKAKLLFGKYYKPYIIKA